MGLEYNKNVAKRYLRFYRCHGPYMFDKTSKVFYYYLITIMFNVSVI